MTKWLVGILWLCAHLLVAIALVLAIVDEFELIDQMTMPAICDDYIKGRIVETYPVISFAANCWDWRNTLGFFSLGLLFSILIPSPFTAALAIRVRSKRNIG
ncbi:hypothetical protein KRR38_15840 [Novosphingobium sp. G106]|uniref:hypothetical protein n=1 Tax=Novosphingobium sp. G106 TaxID=2849500 RepID=UPI001C2CE465|nr:hypothetical protein [Novosphingobium sp. G106]MBV1689105.1 hypothetical protein [Novosphingobium sp. G106]